MEPEDFKKFRKSKIHLFSRIKLRNIFPGEWESLYGGEGIEFSKIKPFEPEDDARELDLHTLLQSGEEEVIERVVERQMRIYVCADFSGSMRRFEEMFFSQKPEIKDVAIGLLLFSASNAYSPVGFCAFNQEIKKFFPGRIRRKILLGNFRLDYQRRIPGLHGPGRYSKCAPVSDGEGLRSKSGFLGV